MQEESEVPAFEAPLGWREDVDMDAFRRGEDPFRGKDPGAFSKPVATMQEVTKPASGGLDPELAALLEGTPAPKPEAATTDDSGLDPELAALLNGTPAPATTTTTDDSGLDPELAALLNGTPVPNPNP